MKPIILLLALSTAVFSLLHYIKRRNFLLILSLSFLTILLFFWSFFSFIFYLANLSEKAHSFALVIVYGVVPILFLYLVYLFFKNTKIMSTYERRSLTAKLSALLGLNLLIVVPLAFYLFVMGGHRPLSLIFYGAMSTLVLVDLLFVFYFVLYLIYSVYYQLVPVKDKIDYIIVLGSGLDGDKVTPLLKSRIDKAVEYHKLNPKSKIVVSGGQGDDELISEALAMSRYLLSIGIDAQDIIIEDKSTTTYENLKFSHQLIKKDTPRKDINIYFSTNNYHVLRAALYAKQLKINIEGIGAPTAFYFLPTALIREYIALLVKYKIFTAINIIFIMLLVIFSYAPF